MTSVRKIENCAKLQKLHQPYTDLESTTSMQHMEFVGHTRLTE